MEIIDGQVSHRATTWLESLVRTLADEAARHAEAHASVVVRVDGDERLVTATSEAAERCEAAQDAAGAGPRKAALAEDRVVAVDDVSACGRWSTWVQACRETGVSSAAVVVGRNDEVRTAVSVHRNAPVSWSPGLLRRLTRIADAVALSASSSLEVERVARVTEDSLAAMRARAVIDQAIGVVMAQNRCDADAAFGILRAASMRRNVKVRVVAAQIVQSVSGAPARVPEFRAGSTARGARPSHPAGVGHGGSQG